MVVNNDETYFFEVFDDFCWKAGALHIQNRYFRELLNVLVDWFGLVYGSYALNIHVSKYFKVSY